MPFVHHGPGVFTCLWKGAITPTSLRTVFFFFSCNGWQPLALVCKLSPPAQRAHLWKLIKLSPCCSHFAQYQGRIKKKPEKEDTQDGLGILQKVITFSGCFFFQYHDGRFYWLTEEKFGLSIKSGITCAWPQGSDQQRYVPSKWGRGGS